VEAPLEVSRRALDLGGGRSVVGIVLHQLGQLERVGHLGGQRLPGLELAL